MNVEIPDTMQNTKYTLGKGNFSTDSFPAELNDTNGIIPLAVTVDLIVGEEIALFWLDRTPFIHELGAIRQFQIFLKTGLYCSDFGPLMWMLFTVPFPDDEAKAFGMVEYHINPFSSTLVALWRRISNQSHWHIILLGEENELIDIFEVENTYDLNRTLDQMAEVCNEMDAIDFMRAKREFWGAYSLEDLHNMT